MYRQYKTVLRTLCVWEYICAHENRCHTIAKPPSSEPRRKKHCTHACVNST